MQLVVEISEDTFFDLKKKQNRTEVDNAVLNGTPLPKGHGRLIDADALEILYGLEYATKYGNETAEQQAHSYDTMMMYEIADMIDEAPTIIEADRSEE